MADTPQVDPEEVQRLIKQLRGLEMGKFAEALADNIMDPVPEETAAFRSEELAPRSLAAAKYLVDNVNDAIRRKAGESGKEWARRAEFFRTRVGRERRLLQAVVDGIHAKQGRLPNQPNPRQRAYRRLAQRYPQEYLALVREEQEIARQRAREEKAARKQARREKKLREQGRSG